MWLPQSVYSRTPVLYAASGTCALVFLTHSVFAWVSAAFFFASAVLIAYLRAIEPGRHLGPSSSKPTRMHRARGTAKLKRSDRGDGDEISRWAATGFADINSSSGQVSDFAVMPRHPDHRTDELQPHRRKPTA